MNASPEAIDEMELRRLNETEAMDCESNFDFRLPICIFRFSLSSFRSEKQKSYFD